MPIVMLITLLAALGLTGVPGTSAPSHLTDCVATTGSDVCAAPPPSGSGPVDPAQAMANEIDAALTACVADGGIAQCTGADLASTNPRFSTPLSIPCTEPGGACIHYDPNGAETWQVVVRGTGAHTDIAYTAERVDEQGPSSTGCISADDIDELEPTPIECPGNAGGEPVDVIVN